MPLGAFERQVLRLLAQNRNPDSFVAGATVLHQRTDSLRVSKDTDVFHDIPESIAAAVERDTAVLREHGYHVRSFTHNLPSSADWSAKAPVVRRSNGFTIRLFGSFLSNRTKKLVIASTFGMLPLTRCLPSLGVMKRATTSMCFGSTRTISVWAH